MSTEDQEIEAFHLVKCLAAMSLYGGDEMPYEDHHGDDAMQTMNDIIERARDILSANKSND